MKYNQRLELGSAPGRPVPALSRKTVPRYPVGGHGAFVPKTVVVGSGPAEAELPLLLFLVVSRSHPRHSRTILLPFTPGYGYYIRGDQGLYILQDGQDLCSHSAL